MPADDPIGGHFYFKKQRGRFLKNHSAFFFQNSFWLTLAAILVQPKTIGGTFPSSLQTKST